MISSWILPVGPKSHDKCPSQREKIQGRGLHEGGKDPLLGLQSVPCQYPDFRLRASRVWEKEFRLLCAT